MSAKRLTERLRAAFRQTERRVLRRLGVRSPAEETAAAAAAAFGLPFVSTPRRHRELFGDRWLP